MSKARHPVTEISLHDHACWFYDSVEQQVAAAIEQARADGFVALRTCGDMSWALDGTVPVEDLRRYEILCDQQFGSSRLVGICLYDRRIISPELFQCTLATHSLLGTSEGVQRNPFYDVPDISGS